MNSKSLFSDHLLWAITVLIIRASKAAPEPCFVLLHCVRLFISPSNIMEIMSDDEDEVYNSDEYNSDKYDIQQARRAELECEEERHDRRLYFRNQAALQNYDNNHHFLERVQLGNRHFLEHKSKLDNYSSERLSIEVGARSLLS